MEKKDNRTLRVTELDESLLRDYLIKLLSEGEDFVQEFYRLLVEKSRLFQELLSKERLPSLSVREAISDLLYADEGANFLKSPPHSWEERVEGFARKVRGVSPRSARDTASELLHFTFPDRFVLWTELWSFSRRNHPQEAGAGGCSEKLTRSFPAYTSR